MDVLGDIKEVVELAYPFGFVAGGAARFYAHHQDLPAFDVPKDIDIFMCQSGDVGLSEWNLLLTKLKGNGYRELVTYPNSMILERGYDHLNVQVVFPMTDEFKISCGSPLEVIENFGFVQEQYALWHRQTNDMIYVIKSPQAEAIESLGFHYLELGTGMFLPLSYLWRISKYAAKGYKITPKTVLELVQLWENYPSEQKARVEKMVEDQRESFGLEVDVL